MESGEPESPAGAPNSDEIGGDHGRAVPTVSLKRSATAAAAEPPPAPREKPYDPSPEREKVRGLIAQILVWALVGVLGGIILIAVVVMGLCWTNGSCTPETIELRTLSVLINLVLTPLVGLVGAVTGFYFGEQASARRRGEPGE